jgi:hypothetical protein
VRIVLVAFLTLTACTADDRPASAADAADVCPVATTNDTPEIDCTMPDGSAGVCVTPTRDAAPACFEQCGAAWSCPAGTHAVTMAVANGVACWCEPGPPPAPPF